jgi:hypothetical protein
MRERSERLADAFCILALAALVAAEVGVAFALSITYDEFATIPAAYAHVAHREPSQVPGHPPLVRCLSGAALVALGAHEETAASVYSRTLVDGYAEWGYGERFIAVDNARFKIPFARPGPDSLVTAAANGTSYLTSAPCPRTSG